MIFYHSVGSKVDIRFVSKKLRNKIARNALLLFVILACFGDIFNR